MIGQFNGHCLSTFIFVLFWTVHKPAHNTQLIDELKINCNNVSFATKEKRIWEMIPM